MKNLLVINPIPLICSIKKLIFVFILLLILPLTGCKSVVKETIVFPNGDKYVGEWKDGRPNGRGTDIFPDGSKGIGEFRDGRPWNITHRDKNGNIIVKFVNGKEIRP